MVSPTNKSIECQSCDVSGGRVGGVHRHIQLTSVTPIVIFITFLEQAWQAQQFWCVNCAKISNIKQENKYLVFVSDHLARAKNG